MKKISQKQIEDLYKDLEVLAAEIEKSLAVHGSGLESYRIGSQLLSELRGLMFELTQTKSGKKLLPLLNRYLELEGKVKEIRNDLSAKKAP